MSEISGARNFASVDEDGNVEAFSVVDAPKGRPPVRQVRYTAIVPNINSKEQNLKPGEWTLVSEPLVDGGEF